MTWAQNPMIAFDLETTGVDVETDRIVSAAVVLIHGDTVAHRTEWLINPGVPIPEEASAGHGITTGHVEAQGTDPDATLDVIATVLTGAVVGGMPIVTMNGVFDLTFLDRECRRHDVPTLSQRLTATPGPAGPGLRPVIDIRVLDRHLDKYRKGNTPPVGPVRPVRREAGRRPHGVCGC